jgi:Ohr subfamily peroxiredoxin
VSSTKGLDTLRASERPNANLDGAVTMRALYTAEVTARGGRGGHIRSSDGILDIDLRIPKAMGGPGQPGSNPEQLFAAAYAACFESTLRAIARSQKKLLHETSITARVTLGLTDDRRYQLGVELRGHLEGVANEDALDLMRAAHNVCPYSNATRGNVDVKLLVDGDLAAVA